MAPWSARDKTAAFSDLLRYLPANVVPAAAGLLLVGVLTHVLTPAEYGTYTLVVVTVGLINALGGGWLPTSALRIYAAATREGTIHQFRRQALVMALAVGGGGALIGAVIALSGLLHISGWAAALLVAGLIVTTFEIVFLQDLLRARRDATGFSWSSSLQAVARLGASALGAAILPNRAMGALDGWLIATAGALAWTYARERKGRTLEPDSAARSWRVTAKEMLRFGLPSSVALGFGLVLADGDRYLLQGLTNSSTVGIYSGIYLIINGAVGMLVTVAISSAYPLMVQVWEAEGEPRMASLMKVVCRNLLLIALPGLVGVSILAVRILAIAAGPQYAAHAGIAPLVGAGALGLGLGQLSTTGLLLRRRTVTLAIVIATASVSNVLANIVLIPPLGVEGAAVATVGSYAVYAAGGVLTTWHILRLSMPLLSVIRIAAATASMALVIGVVGGELGPGAGATVLLIGIGASVYASALLLTRELRWHDLRQLRQV